MLANSITQVKQTNHTPNSMNDAWTHDCKTVGQKFKALRHAKQNIYSMPCVRCHPVNNVYFSDKVFSKSNANN